ncbi:MAG: hypothetical protein QOJ42_6738 [Acidobacteriaceae bacterium]|nr:hypothetical protein [Acidobacteriaceae bacterium]
MVSSPNIFLTLEYYGETRPDGELNLRNAEEYGQALTSPVRSVCGCKLETAESAL